ncbi:MAG TPA: alpha-glucan family phosphorylase [Thermomicrobiaceae bacterium]|nr:alpha-glucan family phosphorylase [Thermomicrobiaceae bacterium]
MKPIRTFSVIPALPVDLEPLRAVAFNLHWAWNPDALALFRRLDSDLWEATGHNPVKLLGRLDQAQLEAAAADDSFRAHLDRVAHDLREYLAGAATWYGRERAAGDRPQIAYFSAEFGVTECLSIFAGGLGVLAGDHLKSASDLGLPLVAVGLLYQQGYFHQYLNEAGWQQEKYVDNDFHNLPITLERRDGCEPRMVELEFPGRLVYAQIWRADVGRVPLYLLDTNVPLNRPEDRTITDQLYGGDIEARIKQEIVLGIGGYRALELLGYDPAVYHLNEGHSGFLALERVRRLMEEHEVSFAEASEAASAGLVFTSHTPVPAGHDYFPPDVMHRYFGDYAAALGLSMHDFMALGRQDAHNEGESFCMTILALRLASYSNGVSELHGEVTRRMWERIWPGVPEREVPIGHVTNGIHLRTWVAPELAQLYDRYLGPRWRDEPANGALWQRVSRIPAEELWRVHERCRERLVSFARHRLREQLAQSGATPAELAAANEVLDPEALTIGFSRRFATYKRATLLLRDPERLARILNDPERPVQIIFAGKAHPRDDAGKELIRQIVALTREERFRRRIVFLEDYDMGVASLLVQGADLWLNTPRRPMEASGTSGMKAAANGVLNLSTLDGWWAEAWEGAGADATSIGWGIGRGERYDDSKEQDQVEADDLYDQLERDAIPAFYGRGVDGLPRDWIERMKRSIGTLTAYFNTNRMVWEYAEHFYRPAAARYQELTAGELERAKELAVWKERVRAAWPQLRVLEVDGDEVSQVTIGTPLRVRAKVWTGDLAPEDVAVELYLGPVNADGEITEGRTVPMEPVGQEEDGGQLFEVSTEPGSHSGLHGFTVRVLPRHPDLVTPFVPGLIAWA